MEIGWIAAGGLTVGLIGWCLPRAAERVAIASYPASLAGRLLLPFSDWEARVADLDIETLSGLRRRVAVGGLVATAVSAGAMLFIEPEGGLPNTADTAGSGDEVAQVARPKPEQALNIHAPTVSPDAATPNAAAQLATDDEAEKPETLEEKRQQIRLFSTAKVKPIYRLHDVEGARLTRIAPGSFWDMLGVKEGDVVIELHGSPVNTPAALVELMNVLERDQHVAIAVRGLDGEVRYLEFREPRAE